MNRNNFLDFNFIKEIVKNYEGLESFSEEENYIYAYDSQEDRELYFHDLNKLNYDKIFDFNSLIVNKEKFYKILDENVDKLLFLMINKVLFISSQEELDKYLDIEEYELQSFDIDNYLGISWLDNSTVVVNCKLAKEICKEDCQDNDFLYKQLYDECIWTTLLHELRHLECDLGVIIPEEIIPLEESDEDNVEEYGSNCYYNDILPCDNYEYIFK